MATIKDILAFVACASDADSSNGWIGAWRFALGFEQLIMTPIRRARTLGCRGVYVDSLGGKDTAPRTGEAVFAFSRLYRAYQSTAFQYRWAVDAVTLLPGVLSGWEDSLKLAYLGNPWGDQWLAEQTGMRGAMVVEWTFDYISSCGFNAIGIDALATTALEPGPDRQGKPYGLATMKKLAERYGLRLYSEGPPPKASTWLHDLPAVCGTTQYRPWSEGRLPGLVALPDLGGGLEGYRSILLHNGPAVHQVLDGKPLPDQLAGLIDVAAANGVLACVPLEWARDPVGELRLES